MTFTPFETARLRLRPQEARDAGFALCIETLRQMKDLGVDVVVEDK